MKCEIIRDLLPTYVDGLTSMESNAEIETHIERCKECSELLRKMNAEIEVGCSEKNTESIAPFRKLNKRILQASLATLSICIIIVTAYFYFFEFGWKVNSDDMDIQYSYSDHRIQIEFTLTDGKVLNAWPDRHSFFGNIKFTECYPSVLDDRGEYPNQFSYGVDIENLETEDLFQGDAVMELHFADKTEKIDLKEIAQELKLE